jgi:hypothetical protein
MPIVLDEPIHQTEPFEPPDTYQAQGLTKHEGRRLGEDAHLGATGAWQQLPVAAQAFPSCPMQFQLAHGLMVESWHPCLQGWLQVHLPNAPEQATSPSSVARWWACGQQAAESFAYVPFLASLLAPL